MPSVTRRMRIRAHARRTHAGTTGVRAHARNHALGFYSPSVRARFGVTPAHNPTTQRGTTVLIRDGRKDLTDLERARALAVRLSTAMPKVEYWIVPAGAAFGRTIEPGDVFHRYLGGRRLAEPDGRTPRVDPGSL